MRLSPAVKRFSFLTVTLVMLSSTAIAATSSNNTSPTYYGTTYGTNNNNSANNNYSNNNNYNYNNNASNSGSTYNTNNTGSSGSSMPGSGFGSSYNNSNASAAANAAGAAANQATTNALMQALAMQQQQMGGQQLPGQPGFLGNLMGQQPPPVYTQDQLNKDLQNPDSAAYKANRLADEHKNQNAIRKFADAMEQDNENFLDPLPAPPELETLQDVHTTFKNDPAFADEVLSKEGGLDMRRDSMREAALSYGARGGLSKRNYQIIEELNSYGKVLDGVFDFRQLLIKAPSGMLIEPPIVKESLDATVINDDGVEAATADQILKINKQAKIVTAPRDWRQYLVMTYESEIAPPPRVLWPQNKVEQAEWDEWVRQGWEAGFTQGEDIFETNVNQMVADYNGMVRYRLLLAEGKISQPFALTEDRGVTGGKDEMRVGDRALRITGPSEFLTGADLWNPASR